MDSHIREHAYSQSPFLHRGFLIEASKGPSQKTRCETPALLSHETLQYSFHYCERYERSWIVIHTHRHHKPHLYTHISYNDDEDVLNTMYCYEIGNESCDTSLLLNINAKSLQIMTSLRVRVNKWRIIASHATLQTTAHQTIIWTWEGWSRQQMYESRRRSSCGSQHSLPKGPERANLPHGCTAASNICQKLSTHDTYYTSHPYTTAEKRWTNSRLVSSTILEPPSPLMEHS